MNAFEPFATLRLGTCHYPETLAMILRERGYKDRLLKCVRTGDIVNAQEESEVDIVACMSEQLGISYIPTVYHEVCARGVALGLRLCPGEAYLQLLLQHEDSLRNLSARYNNSSVTVVSKLIPDHDLSPYVMRFRAYEDRLLLEPHWCRHYKDVWGTGPYLFIQPRQ